MEFNIKLIEEIKNVHNKVKLSLFSDQLLDYPNFELLYSKNVDDTYWNYATNVNCKDINKFHDVINNIKIKCKEKDRQPVVVITNDMPLYTEIRNLGNIRELYHETWMLLECLEAFPNYKSKLNIDISIAREDEMELFNYEIINGFTSDDPNEAYSSLPDSYRIAFEKCFKRKEPNVFNYLAKYNDNIVGASLVVSIDKVGYIFMITTNKLYKKNGIFKKLMSKIVRDFEERGIEKIYLQTEKDFYVEKIYEDLGFKEILQSVALRIE